MQYGYSSSNRVALVGYTVIPAILIGLVDVREVKRSTLTMALTGRIGLTRRLEAEVRLPYVVRRDDAISREIFTGTASAATAQQALRQHTVQAGAFLLGNPSGTTGAARESETSELVAFIQSVQDVQPLEWIALCDSSSMDLPQMRNLLIERFFDYYACPPDWAEVAGILNYLARRWELHRNLKTSTPVSMGPELLGMVGRSPAMERLRKTIRKVAQTQATVLIRGESGCGKELATRAIHLCSNRADGPFIAVNCASIPPSLMQSELFGYEKGSFTGAATRKQGLIEAAHQGTLFLDEIGDLSLDLQANLLRFLQEKSIYRVGGLQSNPWTPA